MAYTSAKMARIPTYKHLSLIRPPLDVPDVASFTYPNLEAVVQADFSDKYNTADEVFARFDSDDEEALDLRLSHEYLLISALKLQQADTDDDKRLWSERYTRASIDNFGEPDINEVAIIAATELPMLTDAAKRSNLSDDVVSMLLDSYGLLAKAYDGQSKKVDYSEVIDRVGEYLVKTYPSVRLSLSGNDAEVLDFVAVNRRFSDALDKLEWPKWQIKSNHTAQMSVSSQAKTIYIGKQIPNLTLRRVRALFAHEVLGHAQRAVNGAKIDMSLAYGLSGYLVSEEGLGVVLESAVEGTLPHRVADRYVDIALALGLGGSPQLSRFELYKLTMARMLLRLGPASETADRTVMRRIAWQHVNRIYRGSLGNEFVGVFTRDISYYRGFKRMIEYLRRYDGRDFDEALEFALSGKFDPTNPEHRLYVHKLKFNIAI